MVVWPRRRADDPTAAVERLVGRRGALLRANALALLACGLLLAAAPAAGGATRVARNAYDPTFYSGVLAYATRGGDVVVRRPGRDIVYRDASQPSLHKQFLAYVPRGGGIRVVRWANGREVARVPSGRASRPSLEWPRLAFVYRGRHIERLLLRNLRTGGTATHTRVNLKNHMGRPSLRNNKLAWHTVTRQQSRIFVKKLKTGRKHVVARSRIALLANPSVRRGQIVWTETVFRRSRLKLGKVSSRSRRTLETIRSRSRSYWTTMITGGVVYSTRWTLGSGRADVFRTRY